MEKIQIMDTTLRDGEQTKGKSYSAAQKRRVVEYLLTELGVNRVEVTSARVSDGEQKMLQSVMAWARENGYEDCIEILGFVDGKLSVDWIADAGGRVINLLCKGSLRHCQEQLKKSLHEHLADIKQVVAYAVERGLTVNVYLEDWSQGMQNSPDYVQNLLTGFIRNNLPIKRVMLCDTLGVLNPWQVEHFIRQVDEWHPALILDFHGHNDYGLATANTLAAAVTGLVSGVHCTINGLGERAGNASLDEVVVNINDHTDMGVDVDESKLRTESRYIAVMSGQRVPPNKPISGQNVCVNTAGVHADGDRKGDDKGPLYQHPKLKPERFGAVLEHSLGKLGGVASILNNAERLGIILDRDDAKKISQRVNQLGDEGRIVTIADLPYLIAEILNQPEHIIFEVEHADSHSATSKRATTSATIKFKGRKSEIAGHGDGGFDAFMNALRKWANRRKNVVVPALIDYDMSIPPGGNSDALVQVVITWKGVNGEGEFQTIGVHSDQVLAAIDAAKSAMNVCNQNHHS